MFGRPITRMNISKPFIHRPVATTLLTIAVALAGAIAFRFLPISPLPQVDFPTISVGASLPGASPETMASAVATPLERQFGRIAGVTEMTSASYLGNTSITLQFDLNRNIDAAARDVQAAINAARGYLPANLPQNPSYRKVNSADSPIFMMALTSDVLDKGQMYDAASSIIAQKLAQIRGVGQVIVWGSALPAVRIELNPMALNKYGIGLEDVRSVLSAANANTPKGHFSDRESNLGSWRQRSDIQGGRLCAADRRISQWIGDPLVRCRRSRRFGGGCPQRGLFSTADRRCMVAIFRQPGANIIETVDKIRDVLPQLAGGHPAVDQANVNHGSDAARSGLRFSDVERSLVISVILVILVVFIFLRDPRTTIIPSVAVPVSLVGTFGVMYLLDYSLDNLSLMALDHLDRLCRRRRDCGYRKHLALSGAGHAPFGGGAAAARRRSALPSSA